MFRYGEPYFAVDTNRLPTGTVVFDKQPHGHVSVTGVDCDTIKAAILYKGKCIGKDLENDQR